MNFGNTFGSDSTIPIWYPASGYLLNFSGVLSPVGYFGYYWSVTPDSSRSNYAYGLYFSSGDDVYPSDSGFRSDGRAVRCLQE